jgi:hypothetical protein
MKSARDILSRQEPLHGEAKKEITVNVRIRHELCLRANLAGITAINLIAEREEFTMGRCELCGNEYDKAFEILLAGQSHIFDSFECAIHLLAPECAHCGCKVIGHGVESDGVFYCCAHCANESGVREVTDRAEQSTG